MYQIEALIMISWFQFMDVESRSCEVIKRDPLQLDKNMYRLVVSEINGQAELPCIMLKEENESDLQYRRWMRRSIGASKWDYVKIEDNIKINDCSSLIFESCRKEDIAMYGCFSQKYASNSIVSIYTYLNKIVTPIFFLDLEAPLQIVLSNFTSMNWVAINELFTKISKPIKVANEPYLKNFRVTIRYLPEPWGPCYPCGLNKIAYRQRLVRCLFARIEKIKETVKPYIMYIPIFGCHSWFFNLTTLRLEGAEEMPNFLDIEQCSPRMCVEDMIKKSEKVENFDLQSFLSSLRAKPKKSEPSKVIVPIELPKGQYFEFEGWKIELKCPKVNNKMGKVYWYKNDQLLELKGDRRRRIYQNKKSGLIFKRLESIDSGVYTCVQKNIQKASSELIVKSYSHKYDIRNPLVAMIVATILICISFLTLIFCKIYLYHKGYERLINVN